MLSIWVKYSWTVSYLEQHKESKCVKRNLHYTDEACRALHCKYCRLKIFCTANNLIFDKYCGFCPFWSNICEEPQFWTTPRKYMWEEKHPLHRQGLHCKYLTNIVTVVKYLFDIFRKTKSSNTRRVTSTIPKGPAGRCTANIVVKNILHDTALQFCK